MLSSLFNLKFWGLGISNYLFSVLSIILWNIYWKSDGLSVVTLSMVLSVCLTAIFVEELLSFYKFHLASLLLDVIVLNKPKMMLSLKIIRDCTPPPPYFFYFWRKKGIILGFAHRAYWGLSARQKTQDYAKKVNSSPCRDL